MTARSIRVGLVAAAGLVALYVGLIGWAQGLGHVATQAQDDWPYLAAILAGFGVQVALVAELRARHRARSLEQAAAGAGMGSSAAGMLACCAHHVADVAPLAGASGAAAFLTDWRVEFMLAGISVNALGVAVAARRLRRDGRRFAEVGEPCHAA